MARKWTGEQLYHLTRRRVMEWTFCRSIWTIDRCQRPAQQIIDRGRQATDWIARKTILPSWLSEITTPVFGGGVVVHLVECARKVELIGKTKMIADLLDGPVSCIQQLHGALHPQMIQVT